MNNNVNPNISVDCVIFGFDSVKLKVLLIERKKQSRITPGEILTDLKLPGSMVQDNEDLDISASRVLKELTGLTDIYLRQFYTFGSPQRITEESDIEWLKMTYGIESHRIVTIAYYSLIKIDDSNRNLHSTEGKVQWYDIDQPLQFAFDHKEIFLMALLTLQEQLRNEPVGFELMPKKFSIRQLQILYEIVFGKKLDNRNFRKKLANLKYLIPLNEKQNGVAHKPAQLYKFDKKLYLRLKKQNMGFSF